MPQGVRIESMDGTKEEALMVRIRDPSRQIATPSRLLFGIALSLIGLLILGWGTNFQAMGFTFATDDLLLYLHIEDRFSPSKWVP